jgi:hypothetical protein
MGDDAGDGFDVVGRENEILRVGGLHAKTLHEMRADSIEC